MGRAIWSIKAVAAFAAWSRIVAADWHYIPSDKYPNIPDYGPKPNAAYMVDNQNNFFGVAPDKGSKSGADWLYSGSFENYMAKLRNITLPAPGTKPPPELDTTAPYWLPELAPLGQQPGGDNTSSVYRNILDYGADPTGQLDSTEAINAAVEDMRTCGVGCDNSFSHGAIVYFPPGRYKICRPIIQYYFNQFIGHPLDKPVIVGCNNFKGIALIDTDPYVAGGGGKGWYVNQNNFFRQIRNMVFDLTEMPADTTDPSGNPYVPTGIHWQVAQATSLQYLEFRMPIATTNNSVNHVGLWTENGSGGFVSNLLFTGGNIGWRVGSQQYTAQSLIFTNSLTAVQMIWDWGFNWQGIIVDGGAVAFNISGRGGDNATGIGSVSIIDCTVLNVPVAILTSWGLEGQGRPSIVIDNLVLENVQAAVQTSDTNEVLLSGAANVDLWALGWRYDGDTGRYQNESIVAPRKAQNLLGGNGKSLFTRCRPGYETLAASDFLVATQEGILNDGTGDQAAAINTFLEKAVGQNKVAFFPSGVYLVKSTVFIPVNSRIQGSLWSQIMGAGSVFGNSNDPQVVVRVGNTGDVGSMEIVEMLFTANGATPGAVLMEWNVHEAQQGSAGMWDSHFRVGGAARTGLDINSCPKWEFNQGCMGASLMLHVTPQASGYFENVWAWAADHDGDYWASLDPNPAKGQISVYAGRGMLIESVGPSWFYGTGSEHSILYQYQLYRAKDIYLGHIQTESPYFQPNPAPPDPFPTNFPGDPSFFEDCHTLTDAFGLRIIDSQTVTVHSAGLYSFYSNYDQSCLQTFDCQRRILEVWGSNETVVFNLFTVGVTEVANGVNNEKILQVACQNGFTTEISVWVPTPGQIGSGPGTSTTQCPTTSPTPSSKTSTKVSTTSTKSTAPPKPTGTAWPDCTTEQCKIDAGNNCTCSDPKDKVCEDARPKCCQTKSCPVCICGHAGECLDSPSNPRCCNSNSCYWACDIDGVIKGNPTIGDEKYYPDAANIGCPTYVPNGWNPPAPPSGMFVEANASGNVQINRKNAGIDRTGAGIDPKTGRVQAVNPGFWPFW